MRTLTPLVVASLCTAASAFGFAGSAFAQGAPAGGSPAPTTPATAPTPAANDPHQLPPVAADAKPAPLAPVAPPAKGDDDDADDDSGKKHHKDKEDKEDQEDRVRFRGGVSGYGGAYLFGGLAIPYGGVEGRLGVQIRDWVAVYAEPAFLVGARLGDSGSGVVARVSLGVIPEFTVADLWFIGLGPEAYAAVGGGTRNNVSGGTDAGFFAGTSVIGINGRTGFAFGSKRPGRRKCFTIAFDGRLDFFGGHPAFAPGLSLGYDAM